jgi:PAS domain S-box-containing protein
MTKDHTDDVARGLAEGEELAKPGVGFSEQRILLELFLDQAACAIYASDAEGNLIYANPAARRLCHIDPELRVAEFPPEVCGAAFDLEGKRMSLKEWAFGSALRGESTVGQMIRIVHSDGSQHHLVVSTTPLRKEDGTITGAALVAADITESLDFEEMRKGQETLRLALESAKMGAWEWHPDTGKIYWSDSFFSLLGYRKGEVQPSEEAWWRRIHPEDIAKIESWMPEVLGKPTEFRNEFRIVRPDGEIVWIESRGRSKEDESGKVSSVIGILIDINEKKKLEANLVEERERQIELMQTISHDLRTPLTVVLGHAQLALAREPDDPDLRTNLEAIEKSAGLMNKMIQDLTDLAKLESGQMNPEKEPVHLPSFLTELFSRLKIALDVHRVRILIPRDIPPVDADPALLERIIGNLVSNALKYSPEDRPVLIRAWAGEKEVTISVIDQGDGIPPEDVRSIFRRFYRSQKKRGVEGIGLGLYITKMLVNAHGGRIWVSSEPGKGSVFSFTLPRLA